MQKHCEVCPIKNFLEDIVERKTEVIKMKSLIITQQQKTIDNLRAMAQTTLDLKFN